VRNWLKHLDAKPVEKMQTHIPDYKAKGLHDRERLWKRWDERVKSELVSLLVPNKEEKDVVDCINVKVPRFCYFRNKYVSRHLYV
jgi:hypothetical protein